MKIQSLKQIDSYLTAKEFVKRKNRFRKSYPFDGFIHNLVFVDFIDKNDSGREDNYLVVQLTRGLDGKEPVGGFCLIFHHMEDLREFIDTLDNCASKQEDLVYKREEDDK